MKQNFELKDFVKEVRDVDDGATTERYRCAVEAAHLINELEAAGVLNPFERALALQRLRRDLGFDRK